MKKHPSAFKLCGHLAEAVKLVKDEAVTLFEGDDENATLVRDKVMTQSSPTYI